eukprot:jgi/Undpi1/1210/HiC_scaffold_107.g14124.m1
MVAVVRQAALWLGLASVSVRGERIWAVIVAGSSGFHNYRHQADVCHAYHLVRRNGVPEERIILMSYGDAADSVHNPVRGTLFNKPTPGGVAGYDVNDGCKLCYTGEDVTAENLLAVLKGDGKTTEGKPVLESTKDDRVFVYFASHGGLGLVTMPVGDPVYAQDLVDTLGYMWSNDMYKELVFYLEAGEAGSMFEGLLPSDINVYATTAASSQESSYGTYCGMESTVDGTIIGTCLGDVYSANSLSNSDTPGLFHTETLDSLFSPMKNGPSSSRSHVQKFGSKGIDGIDGIDSVQGAADVPSEEVEVGVAYGDRAAEVAGTRIPKFGVDSRDVKLHFLHHQRDMATRYDSKEDVAHFEKQIAVESAARINAWNVFRGIVQETVDGGLAPFVPDRLTKHSCLKDASTAVIARCGPWNDYSLKFVSYLAALCEEDYPAFTIAAAAEKVCPRVKVG